MYFSKLQLYHLKNPWMDAFNESLNFPKEKIFV